MWCFSWEENGGLELNRGRSGRTNKADGAMLGVVRVDVAAEMLRVVFARLRPPLVRIESAGPRGKLHRERKNEEDSTRASHWLLVIRQRSREVELL